MKNKNIFRVVLIVFVLAVLYFLMDMASQTTAPWNKKKQLERALPN